MRTKKKKAATKKVKKKKPSRVKKKPSKKAVRKKSKKAHFKILGTYTQGSYSSATTIAMPTKSSGHEVIITIGKTSFTVRAIDLAARNNLIQTINRAIKFDPKNFSVVKGYIPKPPIPKPTPKEKPKNPSAKKSDPEENEPLDQL